MFLIFSKVNDAGLTFNVNSWSSLTQSLGDSQGVPGVDRSMNEHNIRNIYVVSSINWICSLGGVDQESVIKLWPENVWTLLHEELGREIVSKHLRPVGWRLEESELRAGLVSPLPS